MAALVAAACAIGCGGNSDAGSDGAASADTAGSGGSSSNAGCGDSGGTDNAPAARGNLAFTVAGCTLYTAAVGPDLDADLQTRFMQLSATDGTNPGRRVEDGQEGARVGCRASGNDALQLDLTISGTQTHPSALFVETVGMELSGALSGASRTADVSLQTGAITYSSSAACTISLESNRERQSVRGQLRAHLRAFRLRRDDRSAHQRVSRERRFRVRTLRRVGCGAHYCAG